MPKKLLVSILLACFLLISFTVSVARAQEEPRPWYNPDFADFVLRVFDPDNPTEIFGERYTYAQVAWIGHSLTIIANDEEVSRCLAEGKSGNLEMVRDCLNVIVPSLIGNQQENTESPDQSSLPSLGPILTLAAVGDSFSTNHPASGVQYLADAASRLHIIPEARAQGYGFRNLQPIQSLWKATSNIAYFLMVLVFVAIAFMIMFRVKISPQTVITIQSALPRLILVLILIAFSYAIAGLVIDLSYVVVAAVGVCVKSVGTDISYLDLGRLIQEMIGGPSLLAICLSLLIAATVPLVGGAAIIGAGYAMGAGAVVGAIMGLVMLLLIFIALLVAVIRIVWLQVKTFINLLLLIIAGPLILLLGAFPGFGGIGSWLKNLLANAAVYPTIIIMLFLSHYFFWATVPLKLGPFSSSGLDLFDLSNNTISSDLISLPGFWGSPALVGFLVSLVILFLVPSAGNLIRSLIEGKPFPFGAAIGETFGPSRQVGKWGGLYGAEMGIQALEEGERGAGQDVGRKIAIARTARRLLGLKKQ